MSLEHDSNMGAMSEQHRRDDDRRVAALEAAMLLMQANITRIDKATAILAHSVDGDGVPGILDHLAQVREDLKQVRAEIVTEVKGLQAQIEELKTAGGKRSSKILIWVAGVVGAFLLIGLLSLSIAGIIHSLEAQPNIGNQPQQQEQQGK